MRRKRIRMIYWLALAGSAAMALLGPRLGRLQSTAAMAFAPVSHPANRVGTLLLGTAQSPPDALDSPITAELRDLATQNQRLRQRIEQLQGQLAVLQRVHEDRKRLGEDVLPHCTPVKVIGSDGEVLHVISMGRRPLRQDSPVLHYGPVHMGLAGVIAAAGTAGAQVRLITDPTVRFEGRFGRFDARTDEFTVLNTEPPLIEGSGQGTCRVARAKRQELDQSGLTVGDWAVLADETWPEELRYYRVGQVAAIEDIPAEPGFARVLIRPAVELGQLGELMVFNREGD